MLSVKKWNLFSLFVSVRIKLEIMFKNVLDRKETFFDHNKFSLLKSQKLNFPKGLTHAFGQKM